VEEEKVPISDTVSNFNTYATEFRTKVDSFTKQVLLVSGGIQTITIGAFLGGNTPKLSGETIALLKCGWLYLSACIILCLTLMLLQLIAQAHVARKQAHKIKNKVQGVEVMNTWPALLVLLWCVGISAFFCCILGVYVISKAAISLIGSGIV